MPIYRKDVSFVIVALWICSQQIKHDLKDLRDHKSGNGNKKGKFSDSYENDGDPYKAAYDSDYGLQFSIHTVF